MLTDSEVDRRFGLAVADLNSVVPPVEWPDVSEAAEPFPNDEEHEVPAPVARVVALRVVAVVSIVVTVTVGVIIARRFDLGLALTIAWFALVVPGVTFAALLGVDRLRRSQDAGS